MIFRRDLRIEDNTVLNKLSGPVVGLFIFDPAQIEAHSWQSAPALNFMMQSLEDLEWDFDQRGSRLMYMKGKPEEVLKGLLRTDLFGEVGFNLDYTPFSIARDKKLQKVCAAAKVKLVTAHDTLILDKHVVGKSTGRTYLKFGPFYNAFRRNKIREPEDFVGSLATRAEVKKFDFYLIHLSDIASEKFNSAAMGGRDEGLAILDSIEDGDFDKYGSQRNIPELPTTRLSAHNKFGTVSIREVYAVCRYIEPLRRQLFWRDFNYNLMVSDPETLRGAFDVKFNELPWVKDRKAFRAWCEGKTGIPIIDAGMRELRETHFMHNRVRMICASFLIKNLMVNWRHGERHFAQQLVDYDPAQNFYNWQNVAGFGPFAMAYYRVMNPWTQQKDYDLNCVYIKKWIPELRDFNASEIHNPSGVDGYIKPIVEIKPTRERWLREVKSLK